MLGNNLRTINLDDIDLDERHLWDEFLVATTFAIISTVYTTLSTSPSQSVSGRDTILQIQYKADLAMITLKKTKVLTNQIIERIQIALILNTKQVI